MSIEWKEVKEDRFVNPYNFVPFEKECIRGQEEAPDEERYTGYFECSLRALTPLFIPNTTWNRALHTEAELEKSDEEQGPFSYDFYSYDNLMDDADQSYEERMKKTHVPVIPGSEIRGAVRSVYEAAFNGCVSSVGRDRPLRRRNMENKKPGILKRDDEGWVIIPCTRVMLNVERENRCDQEPEHKFGKLVPRKVYDSWSEGQKIYIIQSKKPYKGKPYCGNVVTEYSCDKTEQKPWQIGYLHKGEKGGKKHHESVFVEKKSVKIKVKKEDVELLEKIIAEYQDKSINKMLSNGEQKWYGEFKVCKERTLVYYNEGKNSSIYMSPACFGKEVFRKQIGSILDKNGRFGSCKDVNRLCSACAVFGMVSQTPRNTCALGSKVRFTDAQIRMPEESTAGDLRKLYGEMKVLPEMGEPRPGAVEFYTLPPYSQKEQDEWKPTMGYWTYDYKRIKGSKEKDYIPLPANQPRLRGRKFYWHSDGAEKLEKLELDKKMRVRIRPLKVSTDDTLFYFRTYFEGLTRRQLQRLGWSLDFNDTTCAHKIGRAKPLGFGSARIRIEEMRLRKFNPDTCAWNMEKEELEKLPEEFGGNKETIKILKMIARWEEGQRKDVSYPKGIKNKDFASYHWFVGNREKAKSSGYPGPPFAKVLPKPEEETEEESSDKWLYRLDKK